MWLECGANNAKVEGYPSGTISIRFGFESCSVCSFASVNLHNTPRQKAAELSESIYFWSVAFVIEDSYKTYRKTTALLKEEITWSNPICGLCRRSSFYEHRILTSRRIDDLIQIEVDAFPNGYLRSPCNFSVGFEIREDWVYNGRQDKKIII